MLKSDYYLLDSNSLYYFIIISTNYFFINLVLPYSWVNDEKFMCSKTMLEISSTHRVTTKRLLINIWAQKTNEFEISPGMKKLKQFF